MKAAKQLNMSNNRTNLLGDLELKVVRALVLCTDDIVELLQLAGPCAVANQLLLMLQLITACHGLCSLKHRPLYGNLFVNLFV